jgi:hypothetical protein
MFTSRGWPTVSPGYPLGPPRRSMGGASEEIRERAELTTAVGGPSPNLATASALDGRLRPDF